MLKKWTGTRRHEHTGPKGLCDANQSSKETVPGLRVKAVSLSVGLNISAAKIKRRFELVLLTQTSLGRTSPAVTDLLSCGD